MSRDFSNFTSKQYVLGRLQANDARLESVQAKLTTAVPTIQAIAGTQKVDVTKSTILWNAQNQVDGGVLPNGVPGQLMIICMVTELASNNTVTIVPITTTLLFTVKFDNVMTDYAKLVNVSAAEGWVDVGSNDGITTP